MATEVKIVTPEQPVEGKEKIEINIEGQEPGKQKDLALEFEVPEEPKAN